MLSFLYEHSSTIRSALGLTLLLVIYHTVSMADISFFSLMLENRIHLQQYPYLEVNDLKTP